MREQKALQSTARREKVCFNEEEGLEQVLKWELVFSWHREWLEQRCGGGRGPRMTR